MGWDQNVWEVKEFPTAVSNVFVSRPRNQAHRSPLPLFRRPISKLNRRVRLLPSLSLPLFLSNLTFNLLSRSHWTTHRTDSSRWTCSLGLGSHHRPHVAAANFDLWRRDRPRSYHWSSYWSLHRQRHEPSRDCSAIENRGADTGVLEEDDEGGVEERTRWSSRRWCTARGCCVLSEVSHLLNALSSLTSKFISSSRSSIFLSQSRRLVQPPSSNLRHARLPRPINLLRCKAGSDPLGEV